MIYEVKAKCNIQCTKICAKTASIFSIAKYLEEIDLCTVHILGLNFTCMNTYDLKVLKPIKVCDLNGIINMQLINISNLTKVL